jgi:hypothetical protein
MSTPGNQIYDAFVQKLQQELQSRVQPEDLQALQGLPRTQQVGKLSEFVKQAIATTKTQAPGLKPYEYNKAANPAVDSLTTRLDSMSVPQTPTLNADQPVGQPATTTADTQVAEGEQVKAEPEKKLPQPAGPDDYPAQARALSSPDHIYAGLTPLYRAAGKGQRPWELKGKGFQNRAGSPSHDKALQYLQGICEDPTLMGTYRISKTLQVRGETVPMVSAGPEPFSGQGGTGPEWSFAIDLHMEPISFDELRAKFPRAKNPTGVHKYTVYKGAGQSLDDADLTLAIESGNLGEFSFITAIPDRYVKAFAKLAGDAWITNVYRPMEWPTINLVKDVMQQLGLPGLD